MRKEYIAISNTNENGLIKNEEYIIVDDNSSIVMVYTQNMDYITSCKADCFDRWCEIY